MNPPQEPSVADRQNERARELGRERGESAASWIVPLSPEHALMILRVARDELGPDGKSVTLFDMYRAPGLSGEWGGDLSLQTILDEIGFDREAEWEGGADPDEGESEIAVEYQDAASSAFYAAIESQAAAYLRDWLDRS